MKSLAIILPIIAMTCLFTLEYYKIKKMKKEHTKKKSANRGIHFVPLHKWPWSRAVYQPSEDSSAKTKRKRKRRPREKRINQNKN